MIIVMSGIYNMCLVKVEGAARDEVQGSLGVHTDLFPCGHMDLFKLGKEHICEQEDNEK